MPRTAVLCALGAAALLAGCGSSGGSTDSGGATTGAALHTITVRHGRPVGGVADITVHSGDPVKLRVRSDVADEIHVHGYNLMKDVPAGGSVRFSFPAKIEGIFTIELENRGEQIAKLTVEP